MEKYQITKTVRFKLEPVNKDDIEREFKVNASDKTIKESLNVFLTTVQNKIIEEFNKIFYTIDENEDFVEAEEETNSKYAINKLIYIDNKFLSSYLRKEYNKFFIPKEGVKETHVADVNYLIQATQDAIDNTQDAYNNLLWAFQREEFEQRRLAEIAYLVKKLNNKHSLSYLCAFVRSIKKSKNVLFENRVSIFNNTVKELESQIDSILAMCSPYNNLGLEVANASFNFYTVNRTSKFTQKQIDDLHFQSKEKLVFQNRKKYQLDKLMDLYIFDKDIEELFVDLLNSPEIKGKYAETFSKEFGIELNTIFSQYEYVSLDYILEGLSLSDGYNLLKFYKGSQKSKINNIINDYLSKKYTQPKDFYINKLKELNLYNLGDDAEHYFNMTLAMKKDSNKQTRRSKATKRNAFLLKKKIYNDYCYIYKKVAMDNGKIKAQIKGIESELNYSSKLKYWSFIAEEDGNRYIYMIPRNEEKLYNIVYNKVSNDEFKLGKTKVFYIESLTLRALRKLCFNPNDSTFKKDINEALKSLNMNILPECEQCDGDDVLNESDKINVYKDVLYARGPIEKELLLFDKLDDMVINPEFESLSDFELALNKYCYTIINKEVDMESLLSYKNGDSQQEAIKFFKFKIVPHRYPSDFDKKQIYESIWDSFWSKDNAGNDFVRRLNPDIKLFRREAKAFSTPSTYLHNRYTQDQYTISLNFTENADCYKENYAFSEKIEVEDENGNKIKKIDTIKANIEKFNTKLSDSKSFDFALGIDSGNDSLEFLTAVGKDMLPLVIKDVYTIKDVTASKMSSIREGISKGYPYKIADNPSYFIDEESFRKKFADTESYSIDDYFKKEEVCALDLTTAKVIRGKIVTNADFKTYFKLQILKAKRQITYIHNRHLELKLEKEGDNKIVAVITTPQQYIIQKYTLEQYPEDKKEELDAELHKRANKNNNDFDKEIKKVICNDYELKIIDGYWVVEYFEKQTLFTKFVKNGFSYTETIKSFDTVYDELQQYLENNDINDAKEIIEINNYRKAIIANMIGVIQKIYSDFVGNNENKAGYIVFEGLDHDSIIGDFKKFEGNVAIPFINALLKKLQEKCLVPPFSEINKLSDEDKFKVNQPKDKTQLVNGEEKPQFGIVRFVTESNTSHCCPMCGKKHNQNATTYPYKKKGNVHADAFNCNAQDGCGFDSLKLDNLDLSKIDANFKNFDENTLKKLFSTLDCNDKIAGYNIAKLGLIF